MDQTSIQNARTYAERHELQLAERLGFGIHGTVFVAENKGKSGQTAVKAHYSIEPYIREREVYERLKAGRIRNIGGFNVPQLIGFDDQLRVVEMSVVARPFLLDFAGAYLDVPPKFSEEAWAAWEIEKQEQFEERWPKVQAVLAALEELDIHMVDVSPSNIAFLDRVD
jgi:hypothetical protein